MNIPLVIAGGIALVTALIHGIVGDVALVRKIKVEALPSTPFGGPAGSKALIRASWHLLTLVFAILAIALFASGIRDTSDFAPRRGVSGRRNVHSIRGYHNGCGDREKRCPRPRHSSCTAHICGWLCRDLVGGDRSIVEPSAIAVLTKG